MVAFPGYATVDHLRSRNTSMVEYKTATPGIGRLCKERPGRLPNKHGVECGAVRLSRCAFSTNGISTIQNISINPIYVKGTGVSKTYCTTSLCCSRHRTVAKFPFLILDVSLLLGPARRDLSEVCRIVG
jgi:hypothetical protein